MNFSLARWLPHRLLWLSLLLLALLACVAIPSRPLIPIDETRYIGVAWEMWSHGEFLVPIKNGLPYSDKPPLMMWLYHVGWTLFGVNEWWPRLVSPLFAGASLLLISRVARRLWPERPNVAGNSALILMGSALWTVFSTAAMFDLILAFFSLLGLYALVVAIQSKRKIAFTLFGVAIGLGILTKGPVIFLHVLPVALLAPWSQSKPLRGYRVWWYVGVSLAILLGIGITLSWAIPAGFAGGEAYQQSILWGQTAGRVVQSFAHQRPFWWYFPHLFLLFFPWILWPQLWRYAGSELRLKNLDAGTYLCLSCILPGLLALSLVSGKQAHYLLPLFPTFAMLTARCVDSHPTQGLSWLPLSGIFFACALLLAASGNLPFLHLSTPPAQIPAILLLVLSILAWPLARKLSAVPAIASFSVFLIAFLHLALAPTLHAMYDIRPLSEAIARAQEDGHQIISGRDYHDQFHFAGRLKKPLVKVDNEKQVIDWLRTHPGDLAVLYLRGSDAHLLQSVPTLLTQQYGGRTLALLEARVALHVLEQKKEENFPQNNLEQSH